MALAGEELDELGPDRIEASDLAGDGAEADLSVALGRGDASSHIYFSDLTHDYIKINAEYTT
jgi:N-acetylglutamate synthase/N-acetylornithine aminotransferase